MTSVGRLIHADWSVNPKKRWAAFATRANDRSYIVERLSRFALSPDEIVSEGERHGLLIGFDFPIGLPRAYADALSIRRFPAFLKQLASDVRFADFGRPASVQSEISAYRPFFPAKPGGTSRAQLVAAHKVLAFQDLLRECERKTPTRPAACSLFWTLGGNQVGKAAISGWTEILAPLASYADTRFWPFDGAIHDLTSQKRVTVVETYPAEAMRFLDVSAGQKFSKKRPADRASVAGRILSSARAVNVDLSERVRASVMDGFGQDKQGEDRFDALLGLIGMAAVLSAQRPEGSPSDIAARSIEGWILGQSDVAARTPI